MESAFFTVADWVANPRSNSIRRKNRRSVLPPRLMDLLFYFAQHPMEVVSRQEIIDNCWDRDVVTDQAITQAIFELRKFLKDGRSAKEAPEYIKTVPKRGYRLLAPVHQLTVEEYIAATSENGAQGTQVIDDEDVAAERELQQPVSAAEPEHEAATSFESKDSGGDGYSCARTDTFPECLYQARAPRKSYPLPRTEGRRNIFNKISDALWLDQVTLGFKKGAY